MNTETNENIIDDPTSLNSELIQSSDNKPPLHPKCAGIIKHISDKKEIDNGQDNIDNKDDKTIFKDQNIKVNINKLFDDSKICPINGLNTNALIMTPRKSKYAESDLQKLPAMV